MRTAILIVAMLTLSTACKMDVSPQEKAARITAEANAVQAPQVEALKHRLSILEAKLETLERVCSPND